MAGRTDDWGRGRIRCPARGVRWPIIKSERANPPSLIAVPQSVTVPSRSSRHLETLAHLNANADMLVFQARKYVALSSLAGPGIALAHDPSLAMAPAPAEGPERQRKTTNCVLNRMTCAAILLAMSPAPRSSLSSAGTAQSRSQPYSAWFLRAEAPSTRSAFKYPTPDASASDALVPNGPQEHDLRLSVELNRGFSVHRA